MPGADTAVMVCVFYGSSVNKAACCVYSMGAAFCLTGAGLFLLSGLLRGYRVGWWRCCDGPGYVRW